MDNKIKTIRILHIGIKSWPYDYVSKDKKLIGIRGGGMNKYCDLLINNLPNNIENHFLCHCMKLYQ